MTILDAYSIQAVSPPDTVFLAAPSEFLVTVQAISTIALALVVFVVLMALVVLLLQFRKLSRSVTEVVKRLERDAGPVVEKARSVADNVDFISAAVRTDVEKMNGSIARLNDRLTQASEHMEDRIQDFNALVEVLQSEAEELALDTAAAVRGVRVGTKALAKGNGGGRSEELPNPQK